MLCVEDQQKREVHADLAIAEQTVAELDGVSLLPKIGEGLVRQDVVFDVRLQVEVMTFGHIGVVGKKGLLCNCVRNREKRDQEGNRESSMHLKFPSNLAGGAAPFVLACSMRLPQLGIFCKSWLGKWG